MELSSSERRDVGVALPQKRSGDLELWSGAAGVQIEVWM